MASGRLESYMDYKPLQLFVKIETRVAFKQGKIIVIIVCYLYVRQKQFHVFKMLILAEKSFCHFCIAFRLSYFKNLPNDTNRRRLF